MNIRENQELWEQEYLSEYASLSSKSLGRDIHEEECDIRPIYQRDRDRIIHCKSFRRLKHKTQVFLAPEGDHYRTRLTHTLEVAQTARTIARALRLNEDLTEAIAMGHDLGHTPFGHAGEEILNKISQSGFKHYEQSIRVVEKLEKNGEGLNLTKEVRDGILNHSTVNMPSTLEGKIVRLADKIAYINHDIDDATRAGILTDKKLPQEHVKVLGNTSRERINTLIHDIVTQSIGINDIKMREEVRESMNGLRKFMYIEVYINEKAKSEEKKAKELIQTLYEYYLKNFHVLPNEYLLLQTQGNETKERIICDYIAGMTDRYAVAVFQNLFIPKFWKLRQFH